MTTFAIPTWILTMIAGYAVGRTIEAACKFLAYLDRETRGPTDNTRKKS